MFQIPMLFHADSLSNLIEILVHRHKRQTTSQDILERGDISTGNFYVGQWCFFLHFTMLSISYTSGFVHV